MPHSENTPHDSSPADWIVHERELLPDEYTQRCRRLLALLHDGTIVAPSLFQPEIDESRIARAVCRVMKISAEHWAGLCSSRRRPYLDQTIKVIAAEQAEVQEQPAVAARGEGGPPAPTTNRPRRDQNQPSRDRQDDILAAIRNEGTPLTRSELVTAMKLKTEGKLGKHLTWMRQHGILVNVKGRGSWLAHLPPPE